jgi:hypothetical protein
VVMDFRTDRWRAARPDGNDGAQRVPARQL